MPSPPSAVSFSAVIEKHGMLTLKDLWTSNLEGGRGSAMQRQLIPPFRSPMFAEQVRRAEAAIARVLETASGADLTRNWAMFLVDLAKRQAETAADRRPHLHAVVLWVNELETADVWAIVGAVDAETDPITVPGFGVASRQNEPPYTRPWAKGDFLVWNDPQPSARNGTRRKYECAQIIDIANTGQWVIRRHWPGSGVSEATFGSYMDSHGSVRVYRLNASHFCYHIQGDDYVFDLTGEDSGVPRRWDIVLPSACVVAVAVCAENGFGFGEWTLVNTSYPNSTDIHLLQSAPGLRTLNGASYLFEEPGPIVKRTRPDAVGGTRETLEFYPTLPIRMQDWASIRTMYAFVGTLPTLDDEETKMRVKVRLLWSKLRPDMTPGRIDKLALYHPDQPWQEMENLLFDKAHEDVSSADQGIIQVNGWQVSIENLPTERRMPYCEREDFFWDPEGADKAWPPYVLEADAWLTFDVLLRDLAGGEKPPEDLSVVVQT